MSQGDTPGSLVETDAGLLVPASAVRPADPPGAPPPELPKWPEGTTLDPDGRKRIVLTKGDQKAIDRALKIIARAGLGIAVGCNGLCGKALVNEGIEFLKDDMGRELRDSHDERIRLRDPDSGYGCQCSRVHFQ